MNRRLPIYVLASALLVGGAVVLGVPATAAAGPAMAARAVSTSPRIGSTRLAVAIDLAR